MSLTVTNPSYDRVYTMYAWRDNNNRLVFTQGEGATTLDGTATRIKAPRFQLRDDQGVMNLSGSPVISLALTRPDKSEDLLACTIIDAANGIVSCPITASATAIAGQAVGEIRLSSTNGTIKFFGVHALIYDGVSNSAAAQSTQFSALVDALQKVATVDPDGSNTVTLDSAIVENGTNPVASGVIYDYIEAQKTTLEKYAASVAVDNAVAADCAYRVYTSADGLVSTGYHLVIAVPATSQITQYLFAQNGAVLYRTCPATNGQQSGSWQTWAKFAKVSDLPTSVSQLANDSGYLVASDIAGKANTADVYSKTAADDKFQTLNNQAQSIDTNRQTTTEDAQKYPSVAAVKNFLYHNFYTETEIDDLLDLVYSKTESDDLFATKANTFTKSEINTKVSSLSNRLALHISVGFNANGVPVKFVDGTTISSGAFTNSDVTKIFISQDVQTISNGAFAGCPALSDIYFDNTSTSYDNSTIPSGVTAHTLDNYHIMNCILDCVKYLDDNKVQSISSGRLATTADSIHYPSVAAVKDFLYSNFYTDDEVDDLLDLVYSKTAADDLFATKANTYTKSEINAIQTENDKRFELQTTVGFDENGIPVFTSNNTSFSAGSCTVNNIKTLFIASNVRLLQSGAFTTNSTGIEVVFIDNEQSGIAIQSGAFPSGATIYYKGQFNALGFVIDAIVAIKPRIMSITIPTSGWSNNEYDITSLMPPSANANTRVDVSIGASVQEQLVADGCGGIYASTDTSNSITTFTLHAMYNKPTANITVQLTLTQLVSV